MNTVYEPTYHDQYIPPRMEIEFDDDVVKPLGTFAGTIYKVLYRFNGSFVPSDTGEQLIADGLARKNHAQPKRRAQCGLESS